MKYNHLQSFLKMAFNHIQFALRVSICAMSMMIFYCYSPCGFASEFLPVAAHKDMVVTEQKLATQVGADILKAGGNAVDAAVAVGYALAVVSPCCGNIGGGGFLLLHLANGKNIFLNFREKAPHAAHSKMYLDEKGNVIPTKSTFGFAAVAVPGTVLGLDTALKKYGTMSRQEVIAPAIQLAERGFILKEYDVKLLNKYAKYFTKSPNVAAIFLKNDKPYQVGDRLVQKELAQTLRLISQKGEEVFYRGEIAKTIVKASEEHGGILSLQDFENYHVQELKPIYCTYRGFTLISAPPPSSGGVTLCEILNILEGYPLKKFGYHSVQSVHYISEAMRYSFADRNEKLGDPQFVHNPVEKLISKKYAAQIREKIAAKRAISISPSKEAVPEPVHTTHYSIVDQWGNAVAVTYTLNSNFGAKVIAGDTGFFLNNEMDDFAIKPFYPNQFGLRMGDINRIQPGKTPLSSMTPTIVTKNGKVVLVLGSPGGPHIITSVLQTILNVLDYGMNIQEAVNAPRFHHQWMPDVIYTEPFSFSPLITEKMKKMGYHFENQEPRGAVEAIAIDPTSGILYGANDGRRPLGKAIGH